MLMKTEKEKWETPENDATSSSERSLPASLQLNIHSHSLFLKQWNVSAYQTLQTLQLQD